MYEEPKSIRNPIFFTFNTTLDTMSCPLLHRGKIPIGLIFKSIQKIQTFSTLRQRPPFPSFQLVEHQVVLLYTIY